MPVSRWSHKKLEQAISLGYQLLWSAGFKDETKVVAGEICIHVKRPMTDEEIAAVPVSTTEIH